MTYTQIFDLFETFSIIVKNWLNDGSGRDLEIAVRIRETIGKMRRKITFACVSQ